MDKVYARSVDSEKVKQKKETRALWFMPLFTLKKNNISHNLYQFDIFVITELTGAYSRLFNLGQKDVSA